MNSKNVCLFQAVFDEKMNSGCDLKGVPFSSKGKPCRQAKVCNSNSKGTEMLSCSLKHHCLSLLLLCSSTEF